MGCSSDEYVPRALDPVPEFVNTLLPRGKEFLAIIIMLINLEGRTGWGWLVSAARRTSTAFTLRTESKADSR